MLFLLILPFAPAFLWFINDVIIGYGEPNGGVYKHTSEIMGEQISKWWGNCGNKS